MEESADSSENLGGSEHPEQNSGTSSLEARVTDESNSRENGPEEHESYADKQDEDYSASPNNRYKNSKIVSSESGAQKPRIERTNDGAVALIYYKDEATGKIEVLFEQRPANESEAGKLSLIGGAIDIVDGRREGGLETLMRELDEEISEESSKAKSIIRNTLDATRDLYTLVLDNVGGETAITYVYKIQINSAKEWDIVKRTCLANDAGTARVLSAKDFGQFTKKDFAFSFGETVLEFISNNNPHGILYFNPAAEGYTGKIYHMSPLTAENYRINNSNLATFSNPGTNFPCAPRDYSVHYNRAA